MNFSLIAPPISCFSSVYVPNDEERDHVVTAVSDILGTIEHKLQRAIEQEVDTLFHCEEEAQHHRLQMDKGNGVTRFRTNKHFTAGRRMMMGNDQRDPCTVAVGSPGSFCNPFHDEYDGWAVTHDGKCHFETWPTFRRNIVLLTFISIVDHQNADRVISHAVETAEKAILHAVENEVDGIFHGAHGITSQSSIALTKSRALGARGGYALMLR